MANLAIKAENISKQYRLGQIGTGTLTHDLNRFWHKVRGKENPYLKIGEENDRSSVGNSEYVWSLRDINFEIEQGDAVGIIGRNGAGKSTLLKLLSKVTKPTTGKLYTNGRIASLLEVGTGFNPEMTGRENVFLNGAILGMTRKEITRKFDEIVDFSGVERYIDTPVKRYSSGMYVRLAFAVAAHLESEILIVDEVLAVGDAEFQKKCLGKMGDVTKNDGRTILFVSHNMAAIENLCSKGILLDNGLLKYSGSMDNVLSKYLVNQDNSIALMERKDREGDGEIIVNKIELKNDQNQTSNEFFTGTDVTVLLHYKNNYKNLKNIIPSVQISNNLGDKILLFHSRLNGIIYNNIPEKGIFTLKIRNLPLLPSEYSISYSIQSEDKLSDSIDNASSFSVVSSKNKYNYIELPPTSHSLFLVESNWEKKI